MAKRKPLGWEDLTDEQIAYVERLEAGDVPPGTAERVRLRVAQPLEKVVPVRMSAAQWDILTREAEELGLRPTTLMRMWVLERLRDASHPRCPAHE